jgi:probable addiction module antidote protein
MTTSHRLTPFDSTRYLDDESAIAEYLSAFLEAGDDRALLMALGQVARARGMTQVARAAGVSRESLYKALGPDGHPQFDTVMKVARALGVQLRVVPADVVPAE